MNKSLVLVSVCFAVGLLVSQMSGASERKSGSPRNQEKEKKRPGLENFFDMSSSGTNSGGETCITSEKLDLDYERMIAVFEENVVVEDPQMKMEADELRVFFTKTNDVRAVTAIGNVRLTREDMTATAAKVIYHRLTGEIIMTGRPHLTRPLKKESMEADRISFYVKNGELSAVNAVGRVKMRKLEPPEQGAIKGKDAGIKAIPGNDTTE